MQSNFDQLFHLFSRSGISFNRDDYVEWAFMRFEREALVEIVLKNLPCRYVLPHYSNRTFEDWKHVTSACFKLCKAMDVKYPPEFFRKLSFRGKVTIQNYRNLVSDFPSVMRSTFEPKIKEMVEQVSPPNLDLESISLDRDWSGSLVEERFQCSTIETDFEFYMKRMYAREILLSKFAPMFQIGLSPKTWQVLEELGAQVEGFASPLKAELLEYCSVFEEDKHFGSLGNFFDVELKHSSYVLHIPFSSIVAVKTKEKIRGSNAKFYIFVPLDIEEKINFRELSPLSKTLTKGSFAIGDHRPHYSYVVVVINGTGLELEKIVESTSVDPKV